MTRGNTLREVLVALGIGVVAGMATALDPWLAAGLGLFGWSLIRTFIISEEHFPMVPLTVLLASTQWALMPAVAYWIDFWHFKMRMYCSMQEYMPIACGGLIAYAIGLALGDFNRRSERTDDAIAALQRFLQSKPHAPWLLMAFAAGGFVLRPYAPSALAFPLVLLGQARYAAVLSLILARSRKALPTVLALMAFEVWAATRGAMFHDLVLWSAILAVAYMHCFSLRIPSRLMILGTGVVVVAGLQIVKGDYREGKWGGGSRAQGVEIAMTGRAQQLDSVSGWLRELEAELPRFNQGWIISAAIAYTPRHHPYLHGSSIEDAVVASALPRFLMRNKERAGSTELLTMTTGIEVDEGTSMGLSPVGESYVNFGPIWGAAFMLLIGLLYSSARRSMTALVQRWPVLLPLIPAALQYSMRAEGQFAGGFNHLVKAFILYSALAFVLTRFELLPTRRQRQTPTAADASAS